jgi:hypothetical protein
MGAHFALELYEEVDLAGLIGRHPGPVLATASDARRSLYSVDLRGHVAFLFGNEGAGLDTALRDAAHMQIAIPMPGKAESLNVAAAAAVCLFERVRQCEALRSPVRYVGMLSGRKRADGVRALLREDGMSDAEIARLQAPIGLDIGGREPGEIALSIAAQLIAVREGKPIAAR